MEIVLFNSQVKSTTEWGNNKQKGTEEEALCSFPPFCLLLPHSVVLFT
jgi:hypothetical protein